jgi:DNA-binding transcriptional ArsR family regulator
MSPQSLSRQLRVLRKAGLIVEEGHGPISPPPAFEIFTEQIDRWWQRGS